MAAGLFRVLDRELEREWADQVAGPGLWVTNPRDHSSRLPFVLDHEDEVWVGSRLVLSLVRTTSHPWVDTRAHGRVRGRISLRGRFVCAAHWLISPLEGEA
jgi:hypothetical protein